MEQLDRAWHRLALCALVVVLIGSALASASAAPTPASTTYTLTGYVDQPGGVAPPPVPAGVTVDLVSAASGTTYKTTTTAGGVFKFTTSSTSSALGPGYWKVYVPTDTNGSVSGCGKCGVLPKDQNPSYAFYSYTDLTSKTFTVTLANVQVIPYNATLNGTVYQSAVTVPGVKVSLLDPVYNGLVLTNATTNKSGDFSMKVPYGSWVLQSIHVSGKDTFTNTTRVTVSTPVPTPVKPNLAGFTVSGYINTTAGRISTAGNATLFDPTTGYVYSVATPPGGYYSIPTYLSNFGHGAQTFRVVLASNTYATTSYSLPVTSGTPTATHNVVVAAMKGKAMGVFTTLLNFSTINPATGKGTLGVNTSVRLGNDSVLAGFPNATVGQLWAQLGLDYNHTLTAKMADATDYESVVSARGPFFLPVQAATTVNGTSFVALKGPQTLKNFFDGCTSYCGVKSSQILAYNWSESYTLNGTLAKNSPSYTIAFTFQHPSSTADVYNYSVALPAGYVLSAGTIKPAHTNLVATGTTGGTWNTFVLESLAAATPSATATLKIVKAANVKPVVNVTSTNFTFSTRNVLNDSEDHYTVVLGVGENATFSAANSVYQSGTNGSNFAWNFGDSSPVASGPNDTANHSYAAPTGATPLKGTLTVTTSGGATNSTNFFVWVLGGSSVPKAIISSNATMAENKTTGGATPISYLEINWGTTIAFNANMSAPAEPNNLSVASFSLEATKTSKKAENFTAADGGNPGANWSVEFSPPSTIGVGAYLTKATIGSTVVSFLGWEYNLTLTVWSVTGTHATTTLVILLNDSQPPKSAFSILNGKGTAVSSSGIVEGTNGTAKIELNAGAAADPNGGKIVKYWWNITNSNNSTLHHSRTVDTVKPYPAFFLVPATTAYTINLTVTDENGNTANTTQTLTVSVNATLRPVMTAKTVSGPTTLTEGKKATFSLNVTNTGGKASFARNITVNWYLLSASGTGSKRYISGSPGATVFYNYTKGKVDTGTPIYGVYPKLAKNVTILAEVSWTPKLTGSYVLYANVTAQNEFVPDYHGGSNLAAFSVSVHANQQTELLEYGGIALAVIVAIGLLIWWTRRPARKVGAGRPSTSKSGLERGSKPASSDSKDDDDDT